MTFIGGSACVRLQSITAAVMIANEPIKTITSVLRNQFSGGRDVESVRVDAAIQKSNICHA